MNESNPGMSGPAPGESPPANTDAPGDALAAAEAKAQANWNSYVRTLAEFDNFRKRADRELDNARKFAIERFAQELLPVSDALEAGINAAATSPGSALIEGAQATLRELKRAFDKAGIKTLDPPAGEAFDPAWHEAMMTQESREHPPGTVLAVVQRGYSLNGRLLRPARVVVAKSPDV